MRGVAPINLASEPFRRDRPLLLAALAATVFWTGMLGIQIAYGWIERAGRVELQASLSKMDSQLRALAAEQARLEAALRSPANADVLDYALFLNELLLRKGISWTRIFNDLEQVVPHNVRLVSVRPQVNADNQIQLDMTVASQATEPVITMLMRLESSALFGATAVTSWLPPSQSEPLYRYRVSVNYAPQL